MNESELKSILKKPKKISNIDYDEISDIISEAIDIFEKEELLLELNTENDENSIVIGDIHGNLESLLKIYEIIKKQDPTYIIFLGDIVDRGEFQLECLIFVLALKILYPNKYYLLKGNHETVEMNKYYGFYNIFMTEFNQYSQFSEITTLYNRLPICIIVNNAILCLHGGIPENFEIIEELKKLHKNKIDSTLPQPIQHAIFQMMWNDPKEGLARFMDNFRGSGIKYYGYEVFEEFMNKNKLKYLIRAHEVFPGGYRWFFDNRLLSIFSSENYRGDYNPNPASYAIIKNKTVSGEIIE
ncbi:MAG: Serine/threonine-protein phosphatase 1 [Promethearchaeota archaeon]|nr:MAG: Serine/threonine-protein phosphatase 1 [Candidatus Lokiarchaeota archaeon]